MRARYLRERKKSLSVSLIIWYVMIKKTKALTMTAIKIGKNKIK